MQNAKIATLLRKHVLRFRINLSDPHVAEHPHSSATGLRYQPEKTPC